MGRLSMYLFLCFWCLPFLCQPWAYVDAAGFIQATSTPAAVAHGRQAYLLTDSSFCFMTSFLGLAPVPRPMLGAEHVPVPILSASCLQSLPLGPQPGSWMGLSWPGFLPPRTCFGLLAWLGRSCALWPRGPFGT